MSSQQTAQDLIQFTRDGARQKAENLIENGASIGISDEFGNTLLHWAASSGNLDLVKYLVWKGADVNGKNHVDRSPLYFAIQHGHLNAVEYFVREKEVDCQSSDRYGFTPLHYTILTSGNAAVIEYLVAQLGDNDDHMNAKTKLGSTPLHLAAMAGELGIVEFLVDKDVDCSLKDAQGMTPLYQSIVSLPSDFKMIKCLIEADPERVVDIPGSNGKSPLFETILLGDFSIAEVLVKYNANVNTKDKDLTTPLQCAASAGHFEIVKLLVKFNADIQAENKNGKTALQLAAEKGYREIVAYLESPPIQKIGIWFDTEEPVISFTGRRKELRNLHREVQMNAGECAQGAAVISHMTSISGLGGIGKSEIIRKYAKQYSLFYHNNVVWVNAENYSTLSDSFYRLAEHKLNISRKTAEGKKKDVRSVVAEVYMFFQRQREKSLFIFDNAEHYGRRGDGIEDFLPSRNLAPGLTRPYIVITSRNQIWRDMKVVPLDTFSKREAAEFIMKALDQSAKGQESDVAKLASTLQYYPLALQQAVAYIKTEREILQNVGESFGVLDYLETYAKESQELLNFEFPYPDEGNSHYTKTTFTTWKITFDKIKKHEQAALFLNVVSFLSPDYIQTRMLSRLIPNAKDLGSATQLLKQYSLISLIVPGVFTVHRLVQQVTRLDLVNGNQTITMLKIALELVRVNIESDDIKENMKYISHAILVWNHASKMNELVKEFGDLPRKIIIALDKSSRFEEANSFGSQSLMTLESILGSCNPRTLNTKHVLGQVLHHQGQYAFALSHFEIVLENLMELNGSDHRDTLGVMFDIALTLDDQGKYTQSLDIYKLLLRKYTEVDGAESLTTLNTQNNYARLLSRMGNYEQSLAIFKDVYEKKRKMFGENHPDTISTQNRVAIGLNRLGKYDESLAATQEVFAKRTEILGRTHPNTMTTESDLATSLIHFRKFREADSVLQSLQLKQRSLLGVEHPSFLNTKISVGSSLMEQCKYSEALIVYQEVFEVSSKVVGRTHPITLSAKSCIGCVLIEQGNHKSAVTLYDELLRDSRDTFSNDHPTTLIYHGNRAHALWKLGHRHQALEILKTVYDKQISTGPETRHSLITICNIASIYSDLEKYEKALQTNRDFFDKSLQLLGENNRTTLRAKHGIAESLEKLGRFREAHENFLVVVEKMVGILGPGHRDTVKSKRALDRLSLLI